MGNNGNNGNNGNLNNKSNGNNLLIPSCSPKNIHLPFQNNYVQKPQYNKGYPILSPQARINLKDNKQNINKGYFGLNNSPSTLHSQDQCFSVQNLRYLNLNPLDLNNLNNFDLHSPNNINLNQMLPFPLTTTHQNYNFLNFSFYSPNIKLNTNNQQLNKNNQIKYQIASPNAQKITSGLQNITSLNSNIQNFQKFIDVDMNLNKDNYLPREALRDPPSPFFHKSDLDEEKENTVFSSLSNSSKSSCQIKEGNTNANATFKSYFFQEDNKFPKKGYQQFNDQTLKIRIENLKIKVSDTKLASPINYFQNDLKSNFANNSLNTSKNNSELSAYKNDPKMSNYNSLPKIKFNNKIKPDKNESSSESSMNIEHNVNQIDLINEDNFKYKMNKLFKNFTAQILKQTQNKIDNKKGENNLVQNILNIQEKNNSFLFINKSNLQENISSPNLFSNYNNRIKKESDLTNPSISQYSNLFKRLQINHSIR